MNPALKKYIPHIIACAIFLISSVFYFQPQLKGKMISQGDILAFKGKAQELVEFEEKNGRKALWSNAIFGGMPSYQVRGPYQTNLVQYVHKIYQLGIERPIGLFFGLMFGFYILLVSLGVNPWLAIVGGIAFGFTTNNFVIFEAGHVSKIYSIMYFALEVLGFFLVFRKNKYILGGSIFALGLALDLYSGHYQMTYYLFMLLGIYALIEIVQNISKINTGAIVKSVLILGLGTLLAITTSSSKLWTTYEYSRDSMRGKPILEVTDTNKAKSSSETEGLDWNYAMQWSNGWIDLPMMIVPGFVGGGSGELVGPGSKFHKIMKRSGAKSIDGKYQAPLYWGKLPFTSGPVYFGAGFCFLFVLGLFLVRGSLKWWLLAGVVLTILLSLGKNLEWFQRLFFDYLPMYNKFRSPNSILTVTAFLVPILAILGLSQIVNKQVTTEKATRFLFIAGGITGGFCLLIALLGSSFFDFSSAGDGRYQQVISQIVADRKSLMRSDALRSFGIIALFVGFIFLYLKEKIKPWMLYVGLGVITTADLWTVGKRYLNGSKFVSERSYKNNFKKRPADKQILQAEKSRGDYRVLDLSVNTFNSNIPSYHHNTIGGYHPAKLQRYQDIIDRHIGKNNQEVLNMLNTKYIIAQSGQVTQNPRALGTAWFVDKVKIVSTANEEIDALNGLKAGDEAVVLDKEFNNYIGDFDPQKSGSVELTKYDLDRLTYKTNAATEQLAVFSEVWYDPDKGWQAYLDGKPVDHIRANYILRAIRVPAGEHKIEFKFEPTSYKTGEMVSLVSSLSLILLTIGGIALEFKKE